MTLMSNRFFLSRSKMISFLAELEATGDNTARSLYLPPGLSLPETEALLERRLARSLFLRSWLSLLPVQKPGRAFFGAPR